MNLLRAGAVGLAVLGAVGLTLASGIANADPAPAPRAVAGNVTTCEEAELDGEILFGGGDGDFPSNPAAGSGTVSGDGTTLNVTINEGYTATGIAVKGANNTNVYDGPFVGPTTVEGMVSPPNPGGTPEISHWFVCGMETPPTTPPATTPPTTAPTTAPPTTPPTTAPTTTPPTTAPTTTPPTTAPTTTPPTTAPTTTPPTTAPTTTPPTTAPTTTPPTTAPTTPPTTPPTTAPTTAPTTPPTTPPTTAPTTPPTMPPTTAPTMPSEAPTTPPPTAGPPPAGELPITGTRTGLFIGSAAALLASGGLLIAFARQRRRFEA